MGSVVDAPRRVPSAPRWIPWVAGVLVVGAAISLAVALLPSWYQLLGPYLIVEAQLAVDAVASVSLFALAAAVLVGAGGWAAGRRRLWWAAAALAVLAVTGLVRDIWFALLPMWPNDVPPAWEIALVALFLGGAAAMAIGHGLLASGLWAARIHAADPGGRRGITFASAFIGVASLVVLIAGSWMTFVIPPGGLAYLWPALIGGLLMAAGYGMLGLVAIAALRAMPPGGALPELLISTGASAAMLGGGAGWVVPYLFVNSWPDSLPWSFTVFAALAAAGLLAMAAGFVLGGLGMGRRSAAREPA